MSADQTIIEALTFRFLQVYVHSVPTYTKKSLQRVLKGYEVLGSGAFTVALYNEELRKKYESQIILISQDVSKEIMSYIHMLYPQNPHFPALELLAQSKYFPPNVEHPVAQDEKKPVYLYSIPEYDSLIFDRKKKKWYRIASEKLEDVGKMFDDFWKRTTKKDMKPLFKDQDKKVLEQLDFILKILSALFTRKYVDNKPPLRVDSKESLSFLSKIKANKDQQSIKDALKILIEEHIKINKSQSGLLYWDIRTSDIPDSEYSPVSPKSRDFFILHNVAIDKLVENIILLDIIVFW